MDEVFHVYNRTNNKELLFLSPSDKRLFLNRYAVYLNPFLKTYCYNLLPNHFHFLVRVRSREEICTHLKKIKPEARKNIEQLYLDGNASDEHLIELEWIRFLTSYAMRFNKRHLRSGNLFYRPFKRLAVADEEYFKNAVLYIHTNAYKHRINDPGSLEWSTYRKLLLSNGNNPVHAEIFNCFNGKDNFIKMHEALIASLLAPDENMTYPNNETKLILEKV